MFDYPVYHSWKQLPSPHPAGPESLCLCQGQGSQAHGGGAGSRVPSGQALRKGGGVGGTGHPDLMRPQEAGMEGRRSQRPGPSAPWAGGFRTALRGRPRLLLSCSIGPRKTHASLLPFSSRQGRDHDGQKEYGALGQRKAARRARVREEEEERLPAPAASPRLPSGSCPDPPALCPNSV